LRQAPSIGATTLRTTNLLRETHHAATKIQIQYLPRRPRRTGKGVKPEKKPEKESLLNIDPSATYR
jgi:hypothetical protein